MTLDEIMNHEGPVKLPEWFWINEKHLVSPPTIRKIQIRNSKKGRTATAIVSWTHEFPPTHESMATTRNKHERVFAIEDLQVA